MSDSEDEDTHKWIAQHSLNGKQYTLVCNVYDSDETGARASSTISLRLKDGNTLVASTSAYIVHKDRLRGRWYEEMDSHTQETAEFALELFNNRGQLRSDLIQKPVVMGSGVWGDELDHGSLLYMWNLSVTESYRRAGLATFMVKALLSAKEVRKCSFAYAWPADTETGPGTELLERKARANMIIRLFRNLGFRRVGRTSFFARALQDKDHPSFKLSAEDDPEALSDYPEVREVLSDLHGPATIHFPVHNAIVNETESDLKSTLLLAHAADPTSLRKTDTKGNTPLHIAAIAMQPNIVRLLLQLGCLPDLQARNINYRTPLEALLAILRSGRDFMQTFCTGSFEGHEDFALQTWQVLAEGAANGKPVQSEDLARVKCGCTCGKCRDGWLSERAAFHLEATLGYHYDMSSVPIHQTWYDLDMLGSEYYPLHLRQNRKPSALYNEIRAIQKDILDLLERGEAPTNVAAKVRSMVDGVSPNHVLAAALRHSKDTGSSYEGDGTHYETFEDDIDEILECENDEDWELMRYMIGISKEQYEGYGYSDD